MNDNPKSDQDFFRIVTIATAIAFGGAGALLGSIQGIGENFSVKFSFWTILAALIGAALGWGFWKVIRSLSDREQTPGRGVDER